MGKSKFGLLGLMMCVAVGATTAQTNRYVAFFADKAGTPYTVDAPEEYLSARALARRTAAGVSITEEDLPVSPAYVTGLEEAGAVVYYTSRWLNCAMFEGTDSLSQVVAGLDMVDSVMYVARGPLPQGEAREFDPKAIGSIGQRVARNSTQNQLLGVDAMHGRGYRGEDMLIAVFDGGFEGVDLGEPFAHLHTDGRVKLTYDFVGNTVDPYVYDDHGTRVLSTMAGFLADSTYLGVAYRADYMLFVTEDVPVEFRLEEFNWLFAAEKADSAGADVIHSSLGYSYGFSDAGMDYDRAQMDGQTTIIAQAARAAADRGVLVVTSAGNEGRGSWRILTSPADVETVLAVGAVYDNGTYATFSSVGANNQAPIKPDVSAMGVSTVLVNDLGNVTTGNGTSYAAPQVAALSAAIWQAFPELTAQEVIEAVRRSGSQYTAPDSLLGYGIPNFIRAERYLVTGLQNEEIPLLKAYPNPNEGTLLTVDLPETFVENEVQVLLYSASGQLLASQTVLRQGGQVMLDTSQWASGTQLLRLQSGTAVGWARILKP